MTKAIDKVFAADIVEGLSATPKYLSSKYFYDEVGDRLFQEIMRMEEYYLTDAEFEVFSSQKQDLLQAFQSDEASFHLIEFGAGDGYKTKILLEHFVKSGVDFEYLPIDISGNVLQKLKSDLEVQFPQLTVKPLQNDYFKAIKTLRKSGIPKVVLFLGGNIGNFDFKKAKKFLRKAAKHFAAGDKMLIGFDLKKDPFTILNAYNDKQGITKAFNLNLLRRMNEELGANFDLFQFDHYPTYDPISGATKSYLISKAVQSVYFEKLDFEVKFAKSEPIFMEISKKYDLTEIERLAKASGFEVVKNFFDCKHYFVDSLWQKQGAQ